MSLIKLSNILKEISEIESERILSKIQNKNFQFFDSGDNGKVYTIDGEDLLMKITSEPDEVAVADVIVGQYDKYNAFIPVVYTDNKKRAKNFYISCTSVVFVESVSTQYIYISHK